MNHPIGYTTTVKLLDVVKLSPVPKTPRQYRFITDTGFYVSNFNQKTQIPDPREHPYITLSISDNKVVHWTPADPS